MTRNTMKPVAVIDIGSNYVRMLIGEVYRNGDLKILEELRKEITIGRDTFIHGKISIESLYSLCNDLKGFVQLMRDYNIRIYRAICTSGMREAQNRDYVIEQIRVKTGLCLEIINSAQERFFMYKGFKNFLLPLSTENAILIVNISSGGVEIFLYEQERLSYSEYIKIGSLRLREMLSCLENRTLDFPNLIKEFVESKIYKLACMLSKMSIQHFVGLGGELKTILSLCCKHDKDPTLSMKKLEHFYEKIHFMTADEIMEHYELTKNQVDILLPSVIIFLAFFKITNTTTMLTPDVSLRHGLLYDLADEVYRSKKKNQYNEDILHLVKQIAQKYDVDMIHTERVRQFALTIFDAAKEIHGLKEKERFYLENASILHDVGRFININEHDIRAYEIIVSQEILGFSDEELQVIANIATYHSETIPSNSDENYKMLSPQNKMVVAKLSSILKLAEALNISHKNKIDNIDIEIQSEQIYFYISYEGNILLEHWSFEKNAVYFEEVMGYKPILKYKG